MMRVLRLVLIGVAVLIPSALYAQPPAGRSDSDPVAATHLRESVPAAASAIAFNSARSGGARHWGAVKKGAIIGLVAGTVSGALLGAAFCESSDCAGDVAGTGAIIGALGAGIGAGAGVVIDLASQSRPTAPGIKPLSDPRTKRLSVSFRF